MSSTTSTTGCTPSLLAILLKDGAVTVEQIAAAIREYQGDGDLKHQQSRYGDDTALLEEMFGEGDGSKDL